MNRIKHVIEGGCKCGAVRVEVALPRPSGAYAPRACDCDFCAPRRAAWLSDPEGRLRVAVVSNGPLARVRQGSGQAELMLCGTCDTLVAVTYRCDASVFGAVNARVCEARFGDATPVSPRTLAPAAKTERWRAVWFKQVDLPG